MADLKLWFESDFPKVTKNRTIFKKNEYFANLKSDWTTK